MGELILVMTCMGTDIAIPGLYLMGTSPCWPLPGPVRGMLDLG
jgi:hypothetical protein